MTFRLFAISALLSLSVAAQAQARQAEQKYAAYLFAYFEGTGDQQEQLRFAVSRDARNWLALNGNKPVLGSDSISQSGGIRDPHILRGQKGEFLITATDMNTAKNGWGKNPGIVLLRSLDLVNWTHSRIVLAEYYPERFADAYWVWAPQTIYDRTMGLYMVYFTLQRRGEDGKVKGESSQSMITYYAYANRDFTYFKNEPRMLFRAKYGCLDNDIVERNGVYHMFYKGNIKNAAGKEVKNGIMQATARRLQGPWRENLKFVDAYADTNTGVEGSSVFKLFDRNEYILMYDLFGSGRYEYQTSTDLTTFSKEPQSFTFDFHPRHGSVIPITAEELDRLQQKWGKVL